MSNSEKLNNPARRAFMFGGNSASESVRIEPTLNLSNFDGSQTDKVIDSQVAPLKTEQIAEETSPALFHPIQTTMQLDMLIKYTKSLREQTSTKNHREMMSEKSDFYDARTRIRLIRSKVKKIKQGTETEEDTQELKKLWDEMTHSVTQLESAATKAQAEKDPPTEASKFSERLVLRNDWKTKKRQFETENAAYLQSEKERRENQTKIGSIKEKFAFWKKENKPASLVLAEQAYQLARKEYAMQLRLAVTERQGKKSVGLAENNFAGNEENITTAFANRFVIAAVSDRAKQEELFVPTGKRSVVLKELREGLRKHSRAIKYGSIFATTGIAIVSGGFFAGANALLGRTISMKLAAGGAVAGSYLGGYVGSAITQNRENKRNASMKKAQKGFSVSQIEQFESEYFKNYKAFERAAKNERKYAVGGAIIGGLAGSAIGGNLDIAEAIEKIPHVQSSSVLDNLSHKESLEAVSKQFSDRIVPSVEEQISPKSDFEVIPKDSSRVIPTIVEDSVPPKVDNDQLIKDIERVLEREPSLSEEIIVEQTPDIHYTFIPGDKINTVSEALCSLVEKNPSLIEGDMTPGEAVREFNHEIKHLKEDNPDYYYDLLDQMGVTSGDIDEVGAGKTYNFAPLFEYLNSLPQ